MALRKSLSKRLFTHINLKFPSPISTTTEHSLISPPYTSAPPHFRCEYLSPPRSASPGFFRRFFQWRSINYQSSPNSFPSFLTLPVGDKLREKLKSLNAAVGVEERICFEGVMPPPPSREDGRFSVNAADVKKVLRFVQLEKVRENLRNIPASTIMFGEFVRICGEVSGDREMGFEFAKALDEYGNVIVLGGVVFLRPDEVAKSMEELISQSIAMPNDPRRKELDNLENKKSVIDEKAQSLVRRELYFGLGFSIIQTLGFMRLTFWELSWDVMEPICFFVTSLHFALAYCFFLRTSTEPSFEGYFQRRFKVKQKKLMEIHNFDVERYNQLCEAFYPNFCKQGMKKKKNVT